jgi:hypothetical protein
LISVASITFVIAGFLVLASVVQPAAERLHLPYTVLLAVVGVAIGGVSSFLLYTPLTDVFDNIVRPVVDLPFNASIFLIVFLPLLTMIQEIEFAPDSPLEGTGFEPSVPGKSDEAFRTASARASVRSVSGCSRYRFLSGACSGTQFIPIHRVLIRPLRRWATSNAAALARDFSLRDLRRDQPGVERVALKVLRAGDTHAPGF